jgi:hypothetical protein
MIRAALTFPILLLSFYGLGEWIRAYLLGDEPLSAGRAARALGFGILAHSLLMTLLGFTGLLTVPIAAAVTALPALIFIKIWFRDIRLILEGARRGPIPKLSLVEQILRAFLIALNLLRLFNAFAPNISWDATSHHYLVASIWLKAGRVIDIPSVVYSYYPSLNEMGIAGTMALGSDFLSNLYGWMFGSLAILILIGMGIRYLGNGPDGNGRGRLGGLVAAFLFFTFPGIGVQTSGGWVDVALACWTLLAIDLILELGNRRAWPVALSATFFSGAMLTTKHLGLLILAGLIVILIWTIYFGKKPSDAKYKGGWRIILGFLAIALLLPLPWYLRAVYFTGNPLYPFPIFGLPGPPQPPFTPSSWVRPDYHRSLTGLLTYWPYLALSPFVNLFYGRNYAIGLLFAFPLVFFVRRLRGPFALIGILSAISVIFMYVLFPVETRYHIPFLAVISLVFGALYMKFVSAERNPWHGVVFILFGLIPMTLLNAISGEKVPLWIWLIPFLATLPFIRFNARMGQQAAIVAFILITAGVSYVHDVGQDVHELGRRYRVVLNLEPEDRYMLRESSANYGVIHYINHDMDWSKMKILTLETRLYRLKAPWVTWYGLKEKEVPSTPAENVAIWYRGGFTHILSGDDVALKAIMYYNIVHQNGWDVPGASPEELLEYLRSHPDERPVEFRLQDLWTNLAGEPFTDRNNHFTHYWLPQELTKGQFPTREINSETWFTADRLELLSSPERLAQYTFVRDFRELLQSGGIKVVHTDGLTFLFETDYPAYLRSHPDVSLETLGLR